LCSGIANTGWPQAQPGIPGVQITYTDQPKTAYSGRNSHKSKVSNYPELNYKCGF